MVKLYQYFILLRLSTMISMLKKISILINWKHSSLLYWYVNDEDVGLPYLCPYGIITQKGFPLKWHSESLRCAQISLQRTALTRAKCNKTNCRVKFLCKMEFFLLGRVNFPNSIAICGQSSKSSNFVNFHTSPNYHKGSNSRF